MEKVGKQTWSFNHGVYVQATGTAVGPKEAQGPIGQSFDHSYENLYAGEDNWELAERRMMKDAVEVALKKANRKREEINYFVGGDLLNQLATTNYYAREMALPYLGLFSACATAFQGLAISSLLVNTDVAKNVLVATSSHNATAERQFRYPTEFGVQKPITTTHTVTGAGAVIISSNRTNIQVKEATIGTVIDLGIKKPYDLGAAMAPAAAHTIIAHLNDTKRKSSYYDLIVTGDLSRVGGGIFCKILREEGIILEENYDDCGMIIYHQEQDIFAGGSGAACAAVVTYGYLLKEMERGKINRMLVVATGALHSALMIQQGESIPCVAHAVSFERVDLNA